MDTILNFWPYIIPFLVVITVLVFVHEMGHYVVARWNGIKVEVFSIGFGPELFGWTDKVGTRWKFSVIPLGGYVRMFGDHDESSRPSAAVSMMTDEEKAVTFHAKSAWQKMAVSAAGPIANYLFSMMVLAMLFATVGQRYVPVEILSVAPQSAAERAGLKAGDIILKVGEKNIHTYIELQEVARHNPDTALSMEYKRQDQVFTTTVTPVGQERTDNLGRTRKVGMLGLTHAMRVEHHKLGFFASIKTAVTETFVVSANMLSGLGKIITGERSTDELGGVLRIAQISGDVARSGGIADLIWLAAFLSINLGLINLFPVPMLDGGHILFYLIEAARGKPLSEKAQEYAFRIGFLLVVGLMLLSFWNDLIHLGVFRWLRGLL